MVKKCRAVHGFTLVELLIVLFIVGLLAFMAVPFTIAWVHQADVQRAHGQLIQAYGMAKSVALRNPKGFFGGAPIVSIKLETSTIPNQLILNSCLEGGNCSNEKIWMSKLPKDVKLVFDENENIKELKFYNTGQLVDWTRIDYKITKGRQSENGEFY